MGKSNLLVHLNYPPEGDFAQVEDRLGLATYLCG